MKSARVILVFLVVGACTFVAYSALQPPQISQPLESPQSTAMKCDQSLWEYVYNPGRLQILEPCISVTGTVDEVRKEADGDVHIRFRLDQEFESLLNEKNILKEQRKKESIQTAELDRRDQVTATKSWPSFLQQGERGRLSGSSTY